MIRHIVAFKLKGTPEERLEVSRRFKAALEALPAQIDVLKSIEVGINENPAETWDVVLTAVVETLEHVAAASIVAPHKEARACVDYTF